MDTYNPLFRRIVDSSVWTESLEVRVLFTTLLAVQDKDHVVRGSLFNISRWANMPEDVVMRAMDVLMSPDTKRIDKQPFDGRRVQQLNDEEWKLLNADKYQRLMHELNMRAKWKKDKERQRANKTKYVGPSAGELGHANRVGDGKEEDAKVGEEPESVAAAMAPTQSPLRPDGEGEVE